ncbi:hypothetical protein SAMN04488511_101164 [Pedobacter suwonensis]|uniref:Uncharacterized protein n=2 Tax=Pedobacter suwonensis TaxID=332999 RepID=A0A1I0SFH9_9SPHI|nr:hypothetical protein SAMN04488511_101164 [Pedobacter suwonensis]
MVIQFGTIPRHAAQYNFSKALIELTNPKVAVASAKGEVESNGKGRRPDQYILGCFQDKGIEVHKTQDCSVYLELTENGAAKYHNRIV